MRRSRFLRGGLVAAVIAMLLLLQAMFAGVPRALPETPDDRVACLSYAPYRHPGESPFTASEISAARIEADLKLLAARTTCIRTYSSRLGLDQVPGIAGRLGMSVLLGAWVGRDPLENQAELDHAIAAANRFPDTVRAVIVGNEVLLRGEQPPDKLAALLAEAKRRTSVPITYADVWEFWERHDSLATQVDFVTVHILPYWEDEPVAVDAAVAHVGDIRRRMVDHFAGKSVLIGETGWPSAGRMRQGARPGLVEAARFHRGFAVAAREGGWDYNLIEAFDQPWKRRLEGAMGGAWGLFGSDGVAKFPAHGPVAADPTVANRLRIAAAGSIVVFVLMALARVGVPQRPDAAAGVAAGGAGDGTGTGAGMGMSTGTGTDVGTDPDRAASPVGTAAARSAGSADAHRVAPGLRPVPPWQLLAVGQVMGLMAGLLLATQWRYLVTWARTPVEVAAIVSIMVCGLLLALAAIPGLGVGASERSARTSIVKWVARIREPAAGFVLFGLAVVALLLAFDPRYRGFAVALFGLPLVALLVRQLIEGPVTASRPEQTVLGLIIVTALATSLVQEGIRNVEAWQFAAVGSGLVYLLAVAPWRATAIRVRAMAASTRPAAAGSKE